MRVLAEQACVEFVRWQVADARQTWQIGWLALGTYLRKAVHWLVVAGAQPPVQTACRMRSSAALPRGRVEHMTRVWMSVTQWPAPHTGSPWILSIASPP